MTLYNNYELKNRIMDCFRFENMDIWKDSISISDLLSDYADDPES